MAVMKDISMLRWRHRYAAKIKDKKAYAVMVAKILALTAAAPFIGGLIGLFLPLIGGISIVIHCDPRCNSVLQCISQMKTADCRMLRIKRLFLSFVPGSSQKTRDRACF